MLQESFTSEAGLRVKIIGVGGAGAAAVEHIASTDLAHTPLALVHTHARVLQRPTIQQKCLIGLNRTHGLGAGGDSEFARIMAESEAQHLKELANGTDLLFLIAGLGGGTGTGVTPVLARMAKETGALVIAIVTTPFEFEGSRRMKQAQVGMQNLRAAADAVICIPNQKLEKLLGGSTTILQAFSQTNELLAQAIRGIYQMLTRPGLINVDFAYLCSVLRGRHVESVMATAAAQGEHRAREVMDQLFTNPFLDGGQALATADQVLVSLVGSSDLTLAEINRIMEQLTRRVENGQLIMGTAIDPQAQERISITVIAARNGKVTLALTESSESNRSSATALGSGMEVSFIEDAATPRPAPRFIAPPPVTTPEATRQLLEKQSSRPRRSGKWTQGTLGLEIVSRGRFEKSEPTIHRGADLDVPTYIRRGVPLN